MILAELYTAEHGCPPWFHGGHRRRIVTQANLDWYRALPKAQPLARFGVEATGVAISPAGHLLRIGQDRFIPGEKKWSRQSAKQAPANKTFIHHDFLVSQKDARKRKSFRKRFFEIQLREPLDRTRWSPRATRLALNAEEAKVRGCSPTVLRRIVDCVLSQARA